MDTGVLDERKPSSQIASQADGPKSDQNYFVPFASMTATTPHGVRRHVRGGRVPGLRLDPDLIPTMSRSPLTI